MKKKKYKLQKEGKLKKKKKKVKIKMMEKEVEKRRCLIEGHPCSVAFVYESDNNVVSPRLVEKLKLPTNFHLNQARIKFGTGQCVKEVLCDITPTNSCHLLLRWAWLHFKTLNLDERSLYLRHEVLHLLGCYLRKIRSPPKRSMHQI